MSVYTRNVEYTFNISGHEHRISDGGKCDDGSQKYIIEDDSYSGSDDCHASDVLYQEFGEWKLEDDGDSFDDYGFVSAEDLLEFISENPPPTNFE